MEKRENIEEKMFNLVVAIDNGENLDHIGQEARDLEDHAQKAVPENSCAGLCLGCLCHAGAAAFVYIFCVRPSPKHSSLMNDTWLATVVLFIVKAVISLNAAIYTGCARNDFMVYPCFRCLYKWTDGLCKAGLLCSAAVLTAGYFMYKHTGVNWILILTLMALWVYSGYNLFSRVPGEQE